MEAAKNAATAAAEKVKEGGEYVASMFKSEDTAQDNKERAAEHRGKAEENWNQATEKWEDSKSQAKQDIAEKKGKLDAKIDNKLDDSNKKSTY